MIIRDPETQQRFLSRQVRSSIGCMKAT